MAHKLSFRQYIRTTNYHYSHLLTQSLSHSHYFFRFKDGINIVPSWCSTGALPMLGISMNLFFSATADKIPKNVMCKSNVYLTEFLSRFALCDHYVFLF